MPSRFTPCPEPGCPELRDRTIGDCPRGHAAAKRLVAQQRSDADRPSAAQRGYDVKWRRNRSRFLAAHPSCIDCGQPATDADHAPTSRAELLRLGVAHPDAWEHLQPRCHSCHSRKTAAGDGGFGNAVTPSAHGGS